MAIPLTYAVVLNWNGSQVLAETLASLHAQSGVNLHILVVDNASVDGSAEEAEREYPGIELLRNASNQGFAAGQNLGMRMALQHGAEYVLVLNNDVCLAPDAVARLLQAVIADPRCAAVGPAVLRADAPQLLDAAWGEIVWNHVIVRTCGTDCPPVGRYGREAKVDCLFGAAMLISAKALREVGGFDESMVMFLEEVEWCQRVRRAGYILRYYPQATAWHHRGHSVRRADAGLLKMYLVRRNSVLFMRRHARPWHWPIYLAWVTASFLGTGLAGLARGSLRSWRVRCAGYRDGWRGAPVQLPELLRKLGRDTMA